MDKLKTQVAHAIRQVQSQIRWKSGKDIQHLKRRVDFGHLAPDATVNDYEAIIAAILNTPLADVFIFTWGDTPYPTVVAERGGRRWLVMFSLSGIMETAFPPDDPREYLSDARFRHLGTLRDLLE